MTRVLLFLSALIAIGLLSSTTPTSGPRPASSSMPHTSPPDDPGLRQLQGHYRNLSKQLVQLMPQQPYIIVDTARNHLYIKRQGGIVLDALASTGSGTILDKPGDGGGQWVFDTPRGEFVVQSKLTKPVWVKPDWAFIEEGLAVPRNPAERVEQGVLGEYALGFGKGYFIHGTLYTRMLGKNVTHGCIRLNDGDLKNVYQIAHVGTPILIF